MAAVFYRLWAMGLQASLLIVIVLTVRLFLGRYPRIYSYSLWILVGVRLLCPIWVESPFSLQPDFSGYSVAVQEGQTENQFLETAGTEGIMDVPDTSGAEGLITAPATVVPEEAGQPELPQVQKEIQQPPPKEKTDTLFSLKQWAEKMQHRFGANGQEDGMLYRLLLILYPLGVTALIIFYLGQYIRMRIRVFTAVREKGNVWLSDRIDSPFVMGVLFPKIYLPYQLKGPGKKHVLRHERTHIKHHDPLIRVIGLCCICLHWWNPLVWLAVYMMNQDMEMFCDETVLRRASLEERKAYALTLLSFAQKRSGLGTGLAFVESHTERRVKNIMKKRKRSLLIAFFVGVLAVFCAVSLLTIPRSKEEGEAEAGWNQGQNDDQETGGSLSIMNQEEESAGGSMSGSGEDGKEEIPIEAAAEGQILEGQSFAVEMNPYGSVTFAAYTPDLSQSPYADVTFKLLREGEEIYSFPLKGTGIREDETVFDEMAAVAFPDLNGDGYTDVVTIAYYEHESGPVPSEARIFTYNLGGYFLEEQYLEEAYNQSHEEKTIADITTFAALPENQDYFVRTSIYGSWYVTGYKLPGIYALAQEEIDGYVNTRLEYGNTFLWTNIDGQRQNVEGYEKTTVTMGELEQGFRINGESMGLSGSELVSYQVDTEGDSMFGHFFYLVDPDHALIYYEGVFFEAVRE